MTAAYPDTLYADRPALPGCAPGKAHVIFCLTPWAADCEDRAITDPRRWPHFWSVTPRRALAEVLVLLRRGVDEIRVERLADGAAGVILVSPRRPLAFCWDLPAAALEAARGELERGIAP